MPALLLPLVLVLAPARAADDCGVALVRVAADQPWLDDGVRAVLRVDRPAPGVDRLLLDLGDAGCGPGGACAPVLEATWQPARRTAFFATRLDRSPRAPTPAATVTLETRDGTRHVVRTTAARGGPAHLDLHEVPGLNAGFTRPVLLGAPGAPARLVTRVIGPAASQVVSVEVALDRAAPVALDLRQRHRVAEGEAAVRLVGPHRTGPAQVVGLARDGAEACFQEVEVELDL